MKVVDNKQGIILYENVLKPEYCRKLVKNFKEEKINSLTVGAMPGRVWEKHDEIIYEVVAQLYVNYKKTQWVWPDAEVKDIQDGGYHIKKMIPGGGDCEMHIDSFGNNAVASLVFFLNEPAEGGVWEFPAQKVNIKPMLGGALMYPPYYTHAHLMTEPSENYYFMRVIFGIIY